MTMTTMMIMTTIPSKNTIMRMSATTNVIPSIERDDKYIPVTDKVNVVRFIMAKIEMIRQTRNDFCNVYNII